MLSWAASLVLFLGPQRAKPSKTLTSTLRSFFCLTVLSGLATSAPFAFYVDHCFKSFCLTIAVRLVRAIWSSTPGNRIANWDHARMHVMFETTVWLFPSRVNRMVYRESCRSKEGQKQQDQNWQESFDLENHCLIHLLLQSVRSSVLKRQK